MKISSPVFAVSAWVSLWRHRIKRVQARLAWKVPTAKGYVLQREFDQDALPMSRTGWC